MIIFLYSLKSFPSFTVFTSSSVNLLGDFDIQVGKTPHMASYPASTNLAIFTALFLRFLWQNDCGDLFYNYSILLSNFVFLHRVKWHPPLYLPIHSQVGWNFGFGHSKCRYTDSSVLAGFFFNPHLQAWIFFLNYLFIFGCVGSSFLCEGFL